MKRQHPNYPNTEFTKDLWHFLKLYKGEFIFLTILLIISSLLGLVPAIILAKIIDLFSSPNISINIFYIYLLFLVGVGITDTIIRHTSKHYLALFTNKIQRYTKVESFEKIMQGDLVWHDKENTGNKIQKISKGESSLGNFMNFYINKGVEIVVNLVGIITIFAFFSLKYALIATIFIICYMFFELRLNKKVAKKSLEINIAKEKASGKTFEFSSNISTIKSLGMELSSNKQIAMQEEKVLLAKKDRRKASTQKWIVVQIIAVLFYSIFIYFVGKDILIGALTIGAIVIYIDYLRRLQGVLNTISSESMNLIDIKYGIFRMMEIYKAVPEINEDNAKNLNSWNEINVKDLNFKYKTEGVLDNFNLNIKKGEKIGIVGKSGSGKSTFFKLLLKLYLPKKGMIYFNDKPINMIKKDSLIKKIAIVPQETEVFNLSIKDNITISKAGRVDYEKYQEALKASKVDKIISKLENKDLSLIGEKGIRLSGGERQRLGIARAIYKDSDIIIFDEATSNLDYETEKDIQESIDKLKDKTLIVSAHRLPTLKNMDKIIFIDKGKVVESGTYNELLRKRGEFYNLWRKQGAWKRE